MSSFSVETLNKTIKTVENVLPLMNIRLVNAYIKTNAHDTKVDMIAIGMEDVYIPPPKIIADALI